MLDTVRGMLVHDTDTMVVSNCLSVIQKVTFFVANCVGMCQDQD